MKRINKILILFLFALTLMFIITWEFLQSRWVAKQVSAAATKYITEVLEAEVEFENLKFNLFPPGANVKNLTFSANREKLKIHVAANELGVYFNPFDVFETDFIVDRIQVIDGSVEIDQGSEKKKTESSGEKEIDLSFFDKLDKIPVNFIELKKITTRFNEVSLFTPQITVENKKVLLDLEGRIENIDLSQITKRDLFLDQLELDVNIDRTEILLSSLKARNDFLTLEAEGKVKSYLSKNIQYNIKSKVRAPANVLHDYVDISKVGFLYQGMIGIDLNASGAGSDFKVVSSIEAKNLITDFVDADSLQAKIAIDNKNVIFQDVKIDHNDSYIKLKAPFEFYNFEIKKFVEDPVLLELNRFRLENALKYLKDNVSFLRGAVSGGIRFDLYAQSFSFNILENSKVNELGINVQGGEKLLGITDFDIDQGSVNIKGSDLDLNISLASGSSQVSVIARSDENGFELNIPSSFLELQKISPFLGFPVEGKGLLDLNLKTNKDFANLKVSTDINQFAFMGYRFDKLRGNIKLDMNSNQLDLEKVYATSGKTTVFSRGVIDLKEKDLNINYAVKEASFSELKRILDPVLKDVKISTNELHGSWNTTGQILGKADLNNLLVSGKLQGKNNYFFDENLDNFTFSYNLKEGRINIDDFNASKSGGNIRLKFGYDINEDHLNFWTQFSEIPLQELTYYKRLPLTLKGDLNGVCSGQIKNKKLSTNGKFRLSNTYSFNLSYPDSEFEFLYNNEEVKTIVNLFNSQILVNSDLFLLKEKASNSFVNIDLNIPNIRNLFGVFSVVDLSNSDVSGRVKYSLRSKFNPLTYKVDKLQTNMMNFVVNKKPIFLRYKNNDPEIMIENGKIKKWDVNIRGKKFYILSKGEGDLYGNFNTTTQSKVDASIIEVFNTLISKATGNIRANVNYGHKGKKEEYQAYFTSDNLSIASELIPTAVTKADMRISLEDGVFDIEKFYAQLISGTLELGGKVGLNAIIPDINLRYKFKDAGLTLFKKSNLVFSGSGSLVGKTFPYTLGGDFYIENFVLVNELTDLVGGSDSIIKEDIDYLPGDVLQESDQKINFNLNIATRNPLFARNSLADVGFTGAVQVLGSEKKPRIAGKINLAARNNKVTFKNNEFVFSKGNVFFDDQGEYTNPDLDFAASTQINEYAVGVSVVGPVKNFKVDLTSEPALSQSDILSLIAFGYTEDLSNNLSDTERESMTRAGVGSLIFDSFKINETLKKEFGLQINLGTQITQDETSLLSGRNSEGNNVGRVRSATTFEIKKKINDAMTLSVSSTVGTSTEQRQSMNLNYNLNKNVSVEGVYETRNTDQLETINVDNSVGADVKWKWSFK